MKHHNYKFAFTLAEVLITLAIIGVVAALTMPALLARYQKQVLVTQLKKEYSAWSQAFQALLADEGVDKLSDTQVWAKMSGNECYFSNRSTLDSYCVDFLTGLQKYIKFEIPSESEANEYNGNVYQPGFLIKMHDGAILRAGGFAQEPSIKTQDEIETIKSLGGTMYSQVASLMIDVNGYKKPNIEGRDIFIFVVSDQGRLYPNKGKDDAIYISQEPVESSLSYWKNAPDDGNCKFTPYPSVRGCTARIMEEGWKMNY